CENATVLNIFYTFHCIHSISTVSYVTVEEGGSISIPCFYESEYTDHVKYLCKGHTWESCTYEVKTNEKSSTKYSVSDNKNQRMVTFIINDLKTKDTNYYWCNMEINEGPDDGKHFHVRVTGKGKSFEFTTVQMGYNVEQCEGRTFVYSGKIDETKVTINRNTPGVITVTMSELRERSSGWYWCTDEDLQMPVHVTIKERPTTSKYFT
uniref:Immunoglobulin domain-containing protein n=1 Tax=Sphaeramia orbicularis TaxID=375764 RepID=A0A673CD59_9TELE